MKSKEFYDFLGNKIEVGDYLAKGGRGNRDAEYGMILYKVIEISKNVKVVRCQVNYSYNKGDQFSYITVSRKTSVENTNKYAKVVPSNKVVDLFQKAESLKLSNEGVNLLCNWIHGTESFDSKLLRD